MSGISKKELGDLIRKEIDEALQPVLEQQTDYMEQLRSRRDAAYGRETTQREKGIGAARYLRAFAAGKGDYEKAAAWAEKAWSDHLGDSVRKALLAGDLTAAGAIVPPEFSTEIIELLRARTVIRRAGARVLPLDRGTLTIPRQTGASTASYVGESQNITKTQPTTGQLVLTAKKLAALVPISNDLLLYSVGNTADEFVRDDLVTQMSLREDQAFLRDDGTQHTPKGLRYWAAAANINSTGGDWNTPANAEADIRTLFNDLEGANVPMINPVFFMSPKVRNYLATIRHAGGGQPYFPGLENPAEDMGTIWGRPVYTSTNIPDNLGTNSNEAEVYLVDMSEIIIGESSTIELAVDNSASYVENSSLVSAFSRDETVMRAIARHDFASRHDESIALISNAKRATDVNW